MAEAISSSSSGSGSGVGLVVLVGWEVVGPREEEEEVLRGVRWLRG